MSACCLEVQKKENKVGVHLFALSAPDGSQLVCSRTCSLSCTKSGVCWSVTSPLVPHSIFSSSLIGYYTS